MLCLEAGRVRNKIFSGRYLSVFTDHQVRKHSLQRCSASTHINDFGKSMAKPTALPAMTVPNAAVMLTPAGTNWQQVIGAEIKHTLPEEMNLRICYSG